MICPRCKEEKSIAKQVTDKIIRLECGHICSTPVIEEVKEEIKEEVPPIEPKEVFKNRKTGDTPYPFQEKGIQFAIDHGFKVLIADEQGLGKTIQAIGICNYAMKNGLEDSFFPVLILPKSNVKMQWMVQLFNWGGMEFIPQIIADGKSPPILGFNVYIASYDILRRFSKETKVILTSKWGHEIETTKKENPFYDFPFKTVIMDEVQAIKGESQRTEEVKRICQGKNVIALSGTPIKNNADEYYTILHILAPEKFRSREGYRRQWVKTEWVGGYEKFTGIKYPEAFAEYTSDIIIRRTRDEVKEEIGLRVTKANRIFYHVDFESEKLKSAYKAAEAEFIREMEEKTKSKNPLELIARLSVMRHLVGLNKIQPTVDLAIEFLLENPAGKLVIFAHHQDVMQAIAALLSKWCVDGGYKLPLVYHSGLNQTERFEMIAKFADTPDIPFIIGSTLAMGEGVDRLQEKCNDCILAERQWNPANEEQAESRLVRIGQMKDFVNATYPIATDTIDEYFTEIVESKRRSMKETLEGKTVTQWDETGLLTSLYEAILQKGRKKTKKGW
jgi:SWI/SNF-related matrix-associated actin-dependent regulator of chromatin subfamily A-like protein 1